MNGVLEFISKYGVAGINTFGVILLVFIMRNMSKMKSRKDQIEDILNHKTTKTIINEKAGRVEKHEEYKKPEWEELRECERKFSKTRSGYEVLAQCVTLFPLLGILGTVAGLMLQVRSQNLNEMMGSLYTALGTTFWGLMWAIPLKFIMSIFSARIIFDVEASLDNYDKGFDRNIALNNVTKD